MAEDDTPVEESDEKPFEPLQKHAVALGWVVIAWCRLYDELALLFVDLVAPSNSKALLAAWHSITSDRAQRYMLRAYVQNSMCGKLGPVRRRILWVIGQMDTMEHKRNDAVHAPITIGLDESFSRVVVFPQTQSGNPRAASLKGANLEEEFRIYARNSDKLAEYVQMVRQYLRQGAPLSELPQRPQLEGIVRTSARKRGSAQKPPQAQPQSASPQ